MCTIQLRPLLVGTAQSYPEEDQYTAASSRAALCQSFVYSSTVEAATRNLSGRQPDRQLYFAENITAAELSGPGSRVAISVLLNKRS